VIVEEPIRQPAEPLNLRDILAGALDVVADGVIVIDAQQRVFFFNRGAELTFGYGASEMIGQPIDRLMLPGFAPSHLVQLQAFAASGDVSRPMGRHDQVRGLRRDGRAFPAEATVSKFVREGQPLFMVIIRDTTDRQRSKEALEESEERYRSIVAAMEEGIVLQDASGVIRACNASAERILGLSVDQMMGRTSVDPRWRAVHENGLPFPGEEHPAMVTLRTGQPQSNVIMGVHRPEGALAWISINSQPLFRMGESLPSGVVTSFTDITERRQAERVLRESEERYRSLYQNSLDGILLTAPDGRVFAANAAACAILGRSEEEICQLGRESLLDRSDPLLAPGLEERARTGVFRGELTFLRPDGSPLPCEVSSSVFQDSEGRSRAIVILRDISERKRAESALVHQEALLREILEILPVGVWIVNRDGRVLSGNEAGRTLWAGARYVGIEGYGQYKAWWPDSGKPVQPEEWAAARTITRGETVLDEVVDIETFDGRRRTILNSSIPIRDAHGSITGAIVVNQDITERVQAYQLLEQRVEERTRELSALLEVSRNVAAMLDLAPLLRAILTQLKTVVDYTGAGIAILEDGSTLRIVDYDGPIPRDQMLIAIPLERESGYREVMLRREPFIMDDIWADTRQMREIRQDWEKERMRMVSGVRSWLGVPLITKGRMIGVLRLDHAEPGHFTQDHARLALAFADQAAVAIENARLYEQAQGVAALEERQRLARDLHDSVSQALYGMTLGARTARALVQQDPTQATEALDYVLSLAEAAFTEMRAVIFDLRPDSVEQEGLVCALDWQADLLRIRHQLKVATEFCAEPDLPLAVKEALYRIAREAVNNIAKHAGASRVTLRLDHRSDGTSLEIGDDGAGFATSGAFPGHLGLRSMQERASAIGGTLEIESSPGAGTRIRVCIP
jgi:PAS domain S-box-containing protein